MKITRSWISENGAWTAAMLAEVGIEWPPFKGWVDSLVGREITEAQRINIEGLNRQRNDKHAADAVRHAAKAEQVYYTRPDGKGDWVGSWEKPEGWFS